MNTSIFNNFFIIKILRYCQTAGNVLERKNRPTKYNNLYDANNSLLLL